MKWIGQHIWDFISRFRNDVYLESISASAGSTLGLDGNGKIVKTGRSNIMTSQFDIREATYNANGGEKYIPWEGSPIISPSAFITPGFSSFIAPKNGKITSVAYVWSRDIDTSRDLKMYTNGNSAQVGTTKSKANHTATPYGSETIHENISDWSFSKGDRVSVSFQDGAYTEVNTISILIEYDN